MQKLLFLISLLSSFQIFSQKLSITTIFRDSISIRAIQIYDQKVWYVGTDSKFGYVSLKDTLDKKQIKLSDKKLQFRTLAQDKNAFYCINIESPAYFFRIDKKTLTPKIVYTDTLKTAFYDALHFVDYNGKFAFAFSDPDQEKKMRLATYNYQNKETWTLNDFDSHQLIMNDGEAAFAASNTNIASYGNHVWIATGGKTSRIFRFDLVEENWKSFNAPIIQGSSSQGIYSIDFYKNFGIAVGGDYTKQAENSNNIATTTDAGETWQIQASGKNAGYMTCVKIRPGSKGKDIVAVGDQHISISQDFGKTWTKIADEKNLYVCEWIDKKTLVFAGKDRIIRLRIENGKL